jgi:hypothetical protein
MAFPPSKLGSVAPAVEFWDTMTPSLAVILEDKWEVINMENEPKQRLINNADELKTLVEHIRENLPHDANIEGEVKRILDGLVEHKFIVFADGLGLKLNVGNSYSKKGGNRRKQKKRSQKTRRNRRKLRL